MQIIAATGNMGKLREFARILSPMGFTVISLADLDLVPEAEETGSTFEENALIKAREIHQITGRAVISDDSGLCVEALGGRPGVYSARYGSPDMPHSEKIVMLLAELEQTAGKNRAASYECAIAVIAENGDEAVFHGSCAGEIGYICKGERGFGYDPIFYIGNQSMAEISDEEKDKISHRGKALRMMEAGISEHMRTK